MRTMYTLRVSPAQVERNLAGIVSKMEEREEGLLIQGKGREKESCLVIRQQFLKPSVSPLVLSVSSSVSRVN